MKKTLPFLFSALVLAGCAAPPTNKEAAAPVTNLNSNMTRETSSAPTISESEAMAQEKAIWDTIKNKDYDAFGNMLASDQIEVTNMGVNDKAGSVNSVKTFEPTDLTFSDWKILPLTNDAFVVVYKVVMKGKSNGKDFPPTTALAGSAWVRRDGKWQAIYHQESELEPAQPQPSPAKAGASPTMSPAMSPAMTLTATSDPMANEKLVWDTIKSRNYDAFASFLDEKFIEIEPDGVYDRQGAITGIKGFDGSKAQLSDFKTVNLDKGAALVTYLVKIPGAKPMTSRHTTIWVDRDGKWYGVFHQGTSVKGNM